MPHGFRAPWCSICGHPWWGISENGTPGGVDVAEMKTRGPVEPDVIALEHWDLCGNCLQRVWRGIDQMIDEMRRAR